MKDIFGQAYNEINPDDLKKKEEIESWLEKFKGKFNPDEIKKI